MAKRVSYQRNFREVTFNPRSDDLLEKARETCAGKGCHVWLDGMRKRYVEEGKETVRMTPSMGEPYDKAVLYCSGCVERLRGKRTDVAPYVFDEAGILWLADCLYFLNEELSGYFGKQRYGREMQVAAHDRWNRLMERTSRADEKKVWAEYERRQEADQAVEKVAEDLRRRAEKAPSAVLLQVIREALLLAAQRSPESAQKHFRRELAEVVKAISWSDGFTTDEKKTWGKFLEDSTPAEPEQAEDAGEELSE